MSKCYHCKKGLDEKWIEYIAYVYTYIGEPYSCPTCYREKVNPIITAEDFKKIWGDKLDEEI